MLHTKISATACAECFFNRYEDHFRVSELSTTQNIHDAEIIVFSIPHNDCTETIRIGSYLRHCVRDNDLILIPSDNGICLDRDFSGDHGLGRVKTLPIEIKEVATLLQQLVVNQRAFITVETIHQTYALHKAFMASDKKFIILIDKN